MPSWVFATGSQGVQSENIPNVKGGEGQWPHGGDGCEPNHSSQQGRDVLGICDQARVVYQRNLCQVPVQGVVQPEGGNEQVGQRFHQQCKVLTGEEEEGEGEQVVAWQRWRGGKDEDKHRFDHLLIVFGGVLGIVESINANKSTALPSEDSRKLFDIWVNICPYQGSRTIQSKEVVFIALTRLSPFIAKNANPGTQSKGGKKGPVAKMEDVEFSNKAVSNENSVEE